MSLLIIQLSRFHQHLNRKTQNNWVSVTKIQLFFCSILIFYIIYYQQLSFVFIRLFNSTARCWLEVQVENWKKKSISMFNSTTTLVYNWAILNLPLSNSSFFFDFAISLRALMPHRMPSFISENERLMIFMNLSYLFHRICLIFNYWVINKFDL